MVYRGSGKKYLVPFAFVGKSDRALRQLRESRAHLLSEEWRPCGPDVSCLTEHRETRQREGREKTKGSGRGLQRTIS